MTLEKILLDHEPKGENILPVIKEIQKQFGFVSNEAVVACGEYFKVRPAAIYSAVSFYDQIETETPFDIKVEVCDGMNCGLKKAEEVICEIERLTGRKVGDEFDSRIKIKRESCFGLCTRGPIVKINGIFFEKVTREIIDDILGPYIGYR